MGDTVPPVIGILGPDGSGKTTQIRSLEERLGRSGHRSRSIWFRFRHRISLALLLYARLRGFTVYENVQGYRTGYQEFHRSTLLTRLYPWTVFLDLAPVVLWHTWWNRLRGRVVICDRFVYDTLVDLAIATGDDDIARRPVGRALLALVPEDAKFVILDCPVDVIRARRPELTIDRTLPVRRRMYHAISRRHRIPLVSTAGDPEDAALHITKEVLQ